MNAGEPFGQGEESDRPARRRVPAQLLVVEDDPDVRETLADILQYEGYRVLTASNGKEALEHLRGASRPDLILLDLMMPVLNGWAVREELLRDPELSAIPVVLLSGVLDLDQQARSLNVAGFMVKPIEVNRLLEVVRRVCT
jgi:CheY-like chemotaxis protein